MPNPAHDRVNLVCSAPPVRARIRAADGRIVLEQALAPGYTTLDIGALAAGSYVVEATTANGAVKAMRLVRQ
ncbi:MAG: T9SS type A sorting domain-containing protein [Flavobacteriales bacterium]|nr:T9SS type A sorting domain-containing protein [Flavobacteriales bacterium]